MFICTCAYHLWCSIPQVEASSGRVLEDYLTPSHLHLLHPHSLHGLLETQNKIHFHGKEKSINVPEWVWRMLNFGFSVRTHIDCLCTHNLTHHHVAALSQGTVVRRQVEALQCSTAVMLQWSYGEPPQSAWSAAGPHKSSPSVSCK